MRDADPVILLMLGAGAVALAGCLVVLVWAAVHDAEHCTHWEPYTFTQCQTFHTGNFSNTVCTPVDSEKCTAWDDVPGGVRP